jgi:hypothetical protein
VQELEKSVNAELEQDFPGITKLKADYASRSPKSVAEQLLIVAESIRSVHREMDALQDEMIARLNIMRKNLGVKG